MGVLKAGILVSFCLILLAPIYLMLSSSFQPIKAFMRTPPLLYPATFTLDNYRRIVQLPLVGRWALNTLIVVGVTVVAGAIVNGLAGYVFAFAHFRGKSALFWFMMAPMFVTRYALVVPQFVVVHALHVQNLAAVISMSLLWPVGIYLIRNYFQSIPASLLESARIDGAGEWSIFRLVVMPLSKPVLACSVIFLGINALQDFMWQMLLLQDAKWRTLIVGLISSLYVAASGVYERAVKNIGFDMAVGVTLFIPMLLLFVFASRYFIESLQGGVKE
jgi:multiple sugar transport system permease protein